MVIKGVEVWQFREPRGKLGIFLLPIYIKACFFSVSFGNTFK